MADNYWATAYNISMFHEFLPSARGGYRVHLPTANLLVRRQVIDAVGLLDETLPRGQDTDWTARMTEQGYRLRFVPQARVRALPHPPHGARSLARVGAERSVQRADSHAPP